MSKCLKIELSTDAQTSFSYDMYSSRSEYMRESVPRPYSWDSGDEPWSAPSVADSDRQLALVELREIVQGRYVCANGGQCVDFNTCRCAPGYVGFDCRTPRCDQGYFGHFPETSWHTKYPNWNGGSQGQGSYVCSTRTRTIWEGPDVEPPFDHPNYYSFFMDAPVMYEDGTTSLDQEELDFWDIVTNRGATPQYNRVAGLGNDTNEGWRRDGWWIADSSSDWNKGQCLVTFRRTCGSGNLTDPIVPYERRDPNASVSWHLTDPAEMRSKIYNLWNVNSSLEVVTGDPYDTWKPVVTYDAYRENAVGRWFEDENGAECLDFVLRGCYNGGMCVEHNKCACPEGWTSDDCSVPTCDPPCMHGGNCTTPNTCTCERGWTGDRCEIAICAQDCVHGHCVAPDVCECEQWPNTFKDTLGTPTYRLPSGEPQLTGWTGFDCNTPICVQAEEFRSNTPEGELRLGGRSQYLYGDHPQNNINVDPSINVIPLLDHWTDLKVLNPFDSPLLGMHFDAQSSIKPDYFEFSNVDWAGLSPTGVPEEAGQLVRNDGYSFQAGCSDAVSFTSGVSNVSNRSLSRNSDTFLCGLMNWTQGDYLEGRKYRLNHHYMEKVGPVQWLPPKNNMTGSEGVYACPNRASCIAPDTCSYVCFDSCEVFFFLVLNSLTHSLTHSHFRYIGARMVTKVFDVTNPCVDTETRTVNSYLV